jgi:hypothetical protein
MAGNGEKLLTATFICREPPWPSAKALPSARKKALSKGPFAGSRFAGSPLPRGALGKAFAESKQVFAESSSGSTCLAESRLIAYSQIRLMKNQYICVSV